VSPGQTGDIMAIPAQTRSPRHVGPTPLSALMWLPRRAWLPVGVVPATVRVSVSLSRWGFSFK